MGGAENGGAVMTALFKTFASRGVGWRVAARQCTSTWWLPRRAGNRFVSVPRDLVTRAFKEWSRCVFHGVRGAGELITRASKV